jgi:hypothetical protein
VSLPVAQLAVVVDLAVANDVDGTVLGGDGLVTAFQVDDRKPSHGQPNWSVQERAGAIRPAVHECAVHGLQQPRIDRRDAVERR